MGDDVELTAQERKPAARGGRLLALDGLRAFAVVTVMLFHLYAQPAISWKPWKPSGGFLTLDIFYVLSGFLITSLLLAESDRCGSVNLRSFYARRALRLFPALAILLLAAGVGAAVWSSQPWSKPTLLGLPWVILYVGNWNVIFYGGAIPLGALGQTWSLGVEEQFYLIWPLILLVVLRRFTNRLRIAAVLMAIAIGEMLYRFVAVEALHWVARDRCYFGTDTHSDGLLVGCSLAFFIAAQRGRPPLSERFHRIVAWLTAFSVIALVLLIMRESYVAPSAVWFGISAAVLCTGVIVLNLVTRPLPVLAWVLESRPVVWVGKRSYGIYLWQNTFAFFTSGISHPGIGFNEWQAIRFLVPIAIAAVSYRFVERPFLRRKRSFERTKLVPSALV
ncbi:MAG TPA: acyltransferase [Acidimicrobiales bacterium]|nr:acyltransferase [Acidimicrobiales bacterium]